jgi:hypothetical protein
MVIDDASMVRNYQAQFNRIIRDDSYEGLVKRLRQKGVLVKVFERTAPDVALSSMPTVPQSAKVVFGHPLSPMPLP